MTYHWKNQLSLKNFSIMSDANCTLLCVVLAGNPECKTINHSSMAKVGHGVLFSDTYATKDNTGSVVKLLSKNKKWWNSLSNAKKRAYILAYQQKAWKSIQDFCPEYMLGVQGECCYKCEQLTIRYDCDRADFRTCKRKPLCKCPRLTKATDQEPKFHFQSPFRANECYPDRYLPFGFPNFKNYIQQFVQHCQLPENGCVCESVDNALEIELYDGDVPPIGPYGNKALYKDLLDSKSNWAVTGKPFKGVKYEKIFFDILSHYTQLISLYQVNNYAVLSEKAIKVRKNKVIAKTNKIAEKIIKLRRNGFDAINNNNISPHIEKVSTEGSRAVEFLQKMENEVKIIKDKAAERKSERKENVKKANKKRVDEKKQKKLKAKEAKVAKKNAMDELNNVANKQI